MIHDQEQTIQDQLYSNQTQYQPTLRMSKQEQESKVLAVIRDQRLHKLIFNDLSLEKKYKPSFKD